MTIRTAASAMQVVLPRGKASGQLAARRPIGRLGTASEVAAVVAFLASPAAFFVTGSAYTIDGGYTIA
jgi:NAD(P)-dependent dehydrogenase (short-subunit alcohol dehydrogenase family)